MVDTREILVDDVQFITGDEVLRARILPVSIWRVYMYRENASQGCALELECLNAASAPSKALNMYFT